MTEGPLCICCENGDHSQDWALTEQRCSCPCHVTVLPALAGGSLTLERSRHAET
jgi:hypothetical protein